MCQTFISFEAEYFWSLEMWSSPQEVNTIFFTMVVKFWLY